MNEQKAQYLLPYDPKKIKSAIYSISQQHLQRISSGYRILPTVGHTRLYGQRQCWHHQSSFLTRNWWPPSLVLLLRSSRPLSKTSMRQQHLLLFMTFSFPSCCLVRFASRMPSTSQERLHEKENHPTTRTHSGLPNRRRPHSCGCAHGW